MRSEAFFSLEIPRCPLRPSRGSCHVQTRHPGWGSGSASSPRVPQAAHGSPKGGQYEPGNVVFQWNQKSIERSIQSSSECKASRFFILNISTHNSINQHLGICHISRPSPSRWPKTFPNASLNHTNRLFSITIHVQIMHNEMSC